MTRHPFPSMVVSDQTPSLIDVTAGFRLQGDALDLRTLVMVAMGAKKHVCPGEVVHGHDRYTSELAQILAANGIRVVLLLRDPRDQLISRVFHIRRDSSHPWHTRLQAVELDEAIMACIEGCEGLPSARSMIELTESWLDHGSDFLLVRDEK